MFPASAQETFHDEELFSKTLIFFLLISPLTAFSLLLLQAPYGKHQRPGWGPTISAPVAWFVMESPTIWFTIFLFRLGRNRMNPIAIFIESFYILHYFHRTCIYPLRMAFSVRKNSAPFPVLVASIAFAFNLLNAYVQTRWVSHYASYSENETGWWFWVRIVVGSAVFLTGMAVNILSDSVLLSLKGSGQGYKIPRGGLFEVVSCPNYFGEILEWTGWAVMTWSLTGFGFWLYTCANLVPRARDHHAWYLQKFRDEYPKSRKCLIPFLY